MDKRKKWVFCEKKNGSRLSRFGSLIISVNQTFKITTAFFCFPVLFICVLTTFEPLIQHTASEYYTYYYPYISAFAAHLLKVLVFLLASSLLKFHRIHTSTKYTVCFWSQQIYCQFPDPPPCVRKWTTSAFTQSSTKCGFELVRHPFYLPHQNTTSSPTWRRSSVAAILTVMMMSSLLWTIR